MKKTLKIVVSVILIFAMVMSFSSCSSKTKMTEENVRETVQIVNTALNEFDIKTLKKYVDSETLSYILKIAEKHQQFAELGKAMFQYLTMEVESIDLQNKTVTVKVANKRLEKQGAAFAEKLKNNYSTFQLVKLLDDEDFLDSSLKELTDNINIAFFRNRATITLKVTQGKRNLKLSFDEEAENAVSGGALSSIKSIYS